MKKVLLIVALLILTAIPVYAQAPSWFTILFRGCADSDNGPTNPDFPVPFIEQNGVARDKTGIYYDICVDDKGEKTKTSTKIREYFCKDRKATYREYECPKYDYDGCFDPENKRGAACVKRTPILCGNGVIDFFELCDPPATPCITLLGSPSVCDNNCNCPELCGNAMLDPGEQCDPPGGPCKTPAGLPGICKANCKCQPGPPPQNTCGDLVLGPGEQCDPPGIVCKDAFGKPGTCDPLCHCKAKEEPKKPRCGNTILEAGEQCEAPGDKCIDDSGLDAICSKTCTCKATRIPTWCGNNRVDDWEDCEPPRSPCKKGNDLGICTDACKCKTYITTPSCGDQKVDRGEACDPPGSPAPQCPPILLPNGGCGFPVCTNNCKCPEGRPCDTTGQDRTIGVIPGGQTQPTPTPKSCEELCKERGLTTQQQDFGQFILSQLQQYRCVSGASIRMKGTLTLSGEGFQCKCYSKDNPEVIVNQEKPICDTPCGRVPCDGSAQCPCPGKENCILTATCTWGGWKMQNGRPVPVLGAQ